MAMEMGATEMLVAYTDDELWRWSDRAEGGEVVEKGTGVHNMAFIV